jgi:hypothetical protein
MHARFAISVATLILVVGCGGNGGGGSGAAGTSGGAGSGAAGTGSAGTTGGAGTTGTGGGGATGTGGAVAPPAGVDGTKTLADASATDKAATCDWFAMLAGGYGTESTCGGAVLHAPASQMECTGSFPACDVTFSDFEACVVAVIRGQQACTDTSIQDAESLAVCASVIPAGCF